MIKKHIKTLLRNVVIALAILLMAAPQAALADPDTGGTDTTQGPGGTSCNDKIKIDYSANDVNYYDPCGNNVCGGTTTGGDTITRFLQALAMQENGGKVKGDSGTGARGKYQYIDSTWHAHAKQYYPPADKYANANEAPEEVQDALAYIEYSSKFKSYNGDLFKLAVSHFYPAANDNPALLDVYPPGNVVTPRQYAQQFIQKVNSGLGKDIPIKASQAPDFAMYLAKAGGQGGGGAAGGGVCTTNGVVAGDIVKTALGLAWPTSGHGKDKGDATPAYQTAMPKYNPAAGAASNDPWSDCGVFVATVITATADKDYQKRGTTSQIAYIKQHPEKFDFFESSDYTGSTSKLQPGDILINYGHTYLFTGPYKGGDGKLYNSAAASWHGHVPEADNWYPGFFVARVKKAS
jgi:hypothetical protein